MNCCLVLTVQKPKCSSVPTLFLSFNRAIVLSSAAIAKELVTRKGSITGLLYSNHLFSKGRLSASCQVGSLTSGEQNLVTVRIINLTTPISRKCKKQGEF